MILQTGRSSLQLPQYLKRGEEVTDQVLAVPKAGKSKPGTRRRMAREVRHMHTKQNLVVAQYVFVFNQRVCVWITHLFTLSHRDRVARKQSGR